MRMLRSIYNRGVEAGSAPYVPRLFHDVYTGVDVRQKKALPAGELHKLLYEDPQIGAFTSHTNYCCSDGSSFVECHSLIWRIWRNRL